MEACLWRPAAHTKCLWHCPSDLDSMYQISCCATACCVGAMRWFAGFDDGDLRISAMQLKMFLDEATPPVVQAAAAAGEARRSTVSSTGSTAAALRLSSMGSIHAAATLSSTGGSAAASTSSSMIVPFDALKYTAGECNYGGRVTDDKDRLLLSTILAKYYCQELVQQGSGYSFSASGLYHAPEDGPRDNYLAYIDSLPIQQAPEVFGLHANAAITKDINDTDLMLGSLLAMSGGSGSSNGGAAAEAAAVEARVAAIVSECLQKLPEPFDLEAVGAKFPVTYGQSLNTVLVQEMARYNKLCNKIRESLRSIAAALKGLLVMSSELEATYRSISLNQVSLLVRICECR